MNSWQKRLGDKYYTKLIRGEKDITFEFYRNKHFFQELLSTDLAIAKPLIALSPKQVDIKLPENYAIIFIGASIGLQKMESR